jgi:hypothetical protein
MMLNRTLLFLFSALLIASPAFAHCDTLGGPVIADARMAFQKNDVTPVLKWVKPENESAVRSAFAKSMAARAQGDAARELAETWFFETLVRLHREGEGAPYTGLKAEPVAPGIAVADKAIESGSLVALHERLASGIESSLHQRFEKVMESRKHAGESVESGRAYVAAYVEFMHYAEALDGLAAAPAKAEHHSH